MSSPSFAQGRSRRHTTRRRLLRSLREFALVPFSVVAALVVLAGVAIVADLGDVGGLRTLRAGVSHVIGDQAASTTLQAIATGVITVTSITFSVLLLAVQQTASSLSPVVFDQFVRRKSNQVFLGFFVGLALFAYVVMAAVQDKTPPVLGAAIATLLTAVAMLFLLLLVYTTIDQMQPTSVMRLIHDRTLRARERERPLIRRTRRTARSNDPVSATARAETNGYVNDIDLDRLENVLAEIPRAEICLHVTLGQWVAFGDSLAVVRDDDESDARRLADAVAVAVELGPRRSLDLDATTGIDELANIAWTNGSTARQNPEVACEALDVLKDIASRWLLEEDCEPEESQLSVVYRDNDMWRLCEVFQLLLVAAHESHQAGVAARILDAYGDLVDRAPTAVRERLLEDVATVAPLLDELPPARTLTHARALLAQDRRGSGTGANGGMRVSQDA